MHGILCYSCLEGSVGNREAGESVSCSPVAFKLSSVHSTGREQIRVGLVRLSSNDRLHAALQVCSVFNLLSLIGIFPLQLARLGIV